MAAPKRFPDRDEVATVRAEADPREAGAEAGTTRRLAGRAMARRGMGKLVFLDLVDRSGRVQVIADTSVTGELDVHLGDVLGVVGRPAKSRRGEPSLLAESVELLSRNTQPLPDTFHGLTDVELRYRKRFLDLLMNEETRETFVTRAKVVTSIRRALDEWGFVEVETPILQPRYGGAFARPFVTHHNELDADFYLRIATELYLKRLIVGGLERVYEIGKDFRNEGVSFKHNPEFTMLEWYEAYADYEDVARHTEQLGGRRLQPAQPDERGSAHESHVDFVSEGGALVPLPWPRDARLYTERDQLTSDGPPQVISQRFEEGRWDARREVGDEPDLVRTLRSRTASTIAALPARASGVRHVLGLHFLRRVHAEQAQAAAEHGLGGGAQREASDANARLVHEDAVDRVELVEARGEGFEVGWDRVDLPPGGAVLDHAGKVH